MHIRSIASVFVCSIGACSASTPPTPPADSPSATFQRDYDRLMASPTSPLAVVEARYLAAGESLSLSVDDTGVLTASTIMAADDPRVVMHVSMERGFLCTRGCGATPFTVTSRQSVRLGGHEQFTVILANQSGKGRILVHDAKAPTLTDYQGLNWFSIDDSKIVSAQFVRQEPRTHTELLTNRGLFKTLYIAGRLQFTFGQGEQYTLIVYGYAPEPTTGEQLLIPFRDGTSGSESYGAGRYLEPRLLDVSANTMDIDFNRATNPYCAYSPHYNCPIPTRDNRLPAAVRAGEQIFKY